MTENDIFTFGKFKGKPLNWVMANHGSYVGWCLDNVSGFDIEPRNLKEAFVAGYNEWKRRGMRGYIATQSIPEILRGLRSSDGLCLDEMADDFKV